MATVAAAMARVVAAKVVEEMPLRPKLLPVYLYFIFLCTCVLLVLEGSPGTWGI